MNQRQRFIRKIVYACVDRGAAVAAVVAEPAGDDRIEGRRAGADARRESPEPGRLGRDRPGQRDDQAGHAGHARRGGQHLVGQGQPVHARTKTGPTFRPRSSRSPSLQPNFVSVWVFQGWNLSYNVSVEFDDYHDRYRWVIKGIDFLKRGHRVQPRRAAAADRHRLDDRATRSAAPTSTCSIAGCFARTTTSTARGRWPSATTGWWAANGCCKAEEVVAQGVAVKGKTPAVVLLAPRDVPDQLRRSAGRRRHVRRSRQERLEESRRQLDRVRQSRPAHPVQQLHSPERKGRVRQEVGRCAGRARAAEPAGPAREDRRRKTGRARSKGARSLRHSARPPHERPARHVL